MFYFSRANGADFRTPSPLLLFFPPISSFNAQIKQQVSKIRVFILPKMGSVEWLQTSRPTDGLPSPAKPSLFAFRLFPTSVQFPTRNPVSSKQSFGYPLHLGTAYCYLHLQQLPSTWLFIAQSRLFLTHYHDPTPHCRLCCTNFSILSIASNPNSPNIKSH